MAKYYIGNQSFGHDDNDYLMHYGRKGMKWGKNIFEKDILGSVKKAGVNAGNFLTNAGKSGAASVQKWASSAKKSVSKAVNTPVFGKKQVPVYSHNEGRTQPKGTKYGQPITKTVTAKSVADVANDIGKRISQPYTNYQQNKQQYKSNVDKAVARQEAVDRDLEEARQNYKKNGGASSFYDRTRDKYYRYGDARTGALVGPKYSEGQAVTKRSSDSFVEYNNAKAKSYDATISRQKAETDYYEKGLSSVERKIEDTKKWASAGISKIKSSGAKAINSGKSYAESILGKASNVADSAKKSVSKTASDISKKASKAVSKAKSAASSTVSSIKSSGAKAINSGKNFISGLFGKKHSGGGGKF